MSTDEFNNIDNSRSYATEANLAAGLAKLGFQNDRHLVVRNRAGRFTAIFPYSNLQTGPQAGNIMLYARHGFMTLG